MKSIKLTMNGFLLILLVVTLIIWIGTNDQVMGAATMDDINSEQALKDIIGYLCGGIKVDCSPCREGGNCYEPDILYRHASFLMNRYYQVNRQKGDCDFSGNGITIEFEPSCGKCYYDFKRQ
ncbi:hypothetical protein MKW98_015980 [Papaver atlanticum]|uniref:X8 domain-containing protein n=1 Tax=Papaver atlanticum TaxID=357466 RepID=A0AAD4RVC0_9MAGN|nr:hypothetical protein MKW98_015980 [Papaver atlanticum]